MKPLFSILMGGVLPFGAILIELFFIWSSIWLHQFYYLFGFLFLVFIILIITCAEITIVMCYFQLCSEVALNSFSTTCPFFFNVLFNNLFISSSSSSSQDYHWWWRSFLTPGASALYLFAFSVFYFLPKLQLTNMVSISLYLGYTLIITVEFFTLTGAIGFFSCYWFVYKIYSSIKVE